MPRTPSRTAILRHLETLRRDTLPLFVLPSRPLAQRYRKGGWDVRSVLLHIVDTETVFAERLRRLAAEDKPLLMAIAPDAWHDRLILPKRDLGLAQALFDATRDAIIELIATQPTATWERTGVHSQVGLITFAQAAAKVVDHHRHHLTQIHAALDA